MAHTLAEMIAKCDPGGLLEPAERQTLAEYLASRQRPRPVDETVARTSIRVMKLAHEIDLGFTDGDAPAVLAVKLRILGSYVAQLLAVVEGGA